MHRIVVVGASAGGVTALEKVVAGLPGGFPAAVLIVLHLPEGYKSLLPSILARAGPLPAQDAVDGEALEPGRIYVAVPDEHLLVERSVVRVCAGPREDGFRPSVDVLFRSAAHAWGSGAIGVVLSGALDDGASGLWAIKEMGGIGIVQEPSDASYASMPVEALRRTEADYTVPAADIGALLIRIVAEPVPAEAPGAQPLRAQLEREYRMACGDPARDLNEIGFDPTPYTCPACHGAMYGISEGSTRRFRCHTGHGFTADALLPQLVESTENSLWDAVRSIEEAITLCREAADNLASSGDVGRAEALLERAQQASEKLEELRALALRSASPARRRAWNAS